MSKKVIELLNAGRARELSAIMTYMGQHYALEDKGYGKLGDKLKEVAVVEMKHAEELAERIRFLGGEPIAKPDAPIKIDKKIPEMVKTDIALEDQAIKMYNDAAKQCGQEGDHVSKQIFHKLLNDENDHLDLFQNYDEHIAELGDAYLATLVD